MIDPGRNLTIILVTLILVAGGLGFYWVRTSQARVDDDRKKLTQCISEVDAAYSDLWDSKCLETDKYYGCELSDSLANMAETFRKEGKEDCYRFWGW